MRNELGLGCMCVFSGNLLKLKSVNCRFRNKQSVCKYVNLLNSFQNRLRAVSLLLENPRGKVAEHESRASGEAASSARGGRRAIFSLVSRHARYSRLRRSRVTRARLLFPADFRAKERLLAV